MRPFCKLCIAAVLLLGMGLALCAQSQGPKTAPAKQDTKTTRSKAAGNSRPDIVKAVEAAAQKDCGCGQCAAKGCDPCHGKNCYFCAAKALVAKDCGCGGCNAKGCPVCGPGCDVCKFHLAPAAATVSDGAKPTKKQ